MATQPSGSNAAGSSNGQNVKKFKRGEFLYKEGDKADFVYAVQSGKVAIEVVRPNNKIEVMVLNGPHVYGEQALFGLSKHVLSAEAVTEVTALEIPAAVLKQQLEATPGFLKILLKSMGEQLRSSVNELKSIKMEKESTPCPQLFVPRVFATINLVTRHLGKKLESGDWEISWAALKLFGNRMFLEAPIRIQSAMELLTKLKYVTMHFEKNDEGETELTKFTIHNLQMIEDFGEFYQYNLFKGGVAEILKYDDIACNVAACFVKASEGIEPDRQGATRISFDQVSVVIKEELGVELKNTHIDLLEKKGLFMKRTPTDKEVWLSFDRKEFSQTAAFWKVINEIDKWNQTGRVNMQEEEKKKPKPGENVCPECASAVGVEAKFCSNCGHKIKSAA